MIDAISGHGTARLASYIHLHPAIAIVPGGGPQFQLPDGRRVFVRAVNARVRCVRGEESPRLQGWYSEQFGTRSANSVIELTAEAPLPYVFGYLITEEPDASVMLAATGDDVIAEVNVGSEKRRLVWSVQKGTVST